MGPLRSRMGPVSPGMVPSCLSWVLQHEKGPFRLAWLLMPQLDSLSLVMGSSGLTWVPPKKWTKSSEFSVFASWWLGPQKV